MNSGPLDEAGCRYGDFSLGKRLCNLPALRQVGFQANRRVLAVERLSRTAPWEKKRC